MSKWKSVLSLVMVSMFATPRSSDAGIGELIWGLSGPQLVGFGMSCRLNFHLKPEECLAGARFTGKTTEHKEGRRYLVPEPLLSFGGSYFRSTGTNAETKDGLEVPYRLGEVEMLEGEPALLLKFTTKRDNVNVFLGTGVSYDFLFGSHFEAFDKFAFKFTSEVTIKKVNFGFVARLYPHGFTPDEFGNGERLHYARPAEWAFGPTVGFKFK
jgi:hypothetical protein